MAHSRRRSISSSSSSAESSSDDEHSHGHKQKVREIESNWEYVGTANTAPADRNFEPSANQRVVQPQATQPQTTQPQTTQSHTTMSFPGFPSSPPAPQGEAQQFVGMPDERHFLPPPGPPPPFPSTEGEQQQDRGFHIPGFPNIQHHSESSAPGLPTPSSPPAHPQGPPPPSGFRVPLTTTGSFPSHLAGLPVAYDADGHSPIFLGSALFDKSVHPCKIAPSLNPPCRVPYGGREHEHQGRYDLLPFDTNTMEWVHTSQGRIPPGRRPVEGGYEDYGSKLYHAMGTVSGIRVPGKTAEHLGGCHIAFGGSEQVVSEYEILCWRF